MTTRSTSFPRRRSSRAASARRLPARTAPTPPTSPIASSTGCAPSSCTRTGACRRWCSTRARSSSLRARRTSSTRTSPPRATSPRSCAPASTARTAARPSPWRRPTTHARPRIRWPELAPGDVVEVAFRSWTAGPVGGRGDPPFYRLDYAAALTTHPISYNEVVVESPADHPIYADVVNGKADRTRGARRERAARRPLRLGPPGQRRRRAALSAHQRGRPGPRDVDLQGLDAVPRVVRGRRPRLHGARRAGSRARREAHARQGDARGQAARALRLRGRRHPVRELRERRVVAAEPPAAAPRPARGRLRRQGAAAHHAAQGGRHRRAGGDGPDAAHERAVDRAREGRRHPALRPRHRVPSGARRRDLPRRDEPAVAARTVAVDGRARAGAPHGWPGRDGVAAVEQSRRSRRRLDVDREAHPQTGAPSSRATSAPSATRPSGCART